MATLSSFSFFIRRTPVLKQKCPLHFKLTRSAFFCASNRINLSSISVCSFSSKKTLPMSSCIISKYYSSNGAKSKKNDEAQKETAEKLGLFKRFKQMYRDYWYVLVPVHLVTSAAWFGGFYYLASSGIDIIKFLESWNVSDFIINPLRDSSMGYIAVSYALYKIATPLRYTVTLGGTTLSIKYLKEWGYIKPVPSTEELKSMYKEKKEKVLETMKSKQEMFKKDNLVESFKEKSEEIMQKKEKREDFLKKVHLNLKNDVKILEKKDEVDESEKILPRSVLKRADERKKSKE